MSAAVARFSAGLDELANLSPVAIVTHGTAMTAWLGSVLGLAEPREFWSQLEMPDAYAVDLAARTLERISPKDRAH